MSLQSLLSEYSELPEFLGVAELGVNSRGNSGATPLHVAAIRGSTNELVVLLDAGANVNARGEHGYSPLHEAVEQGHQKAAEVLLGRGASVAARNDDAQTPRDLAVLLGHTQLIGLL